MKILVLSFYYKPDLCAGSFRCTALIKELMNQRDSSIQVDLMTTMPNRYSSFNAEAESFESEGNLNVFRIPIPKHNSGMKDQIKSFIAYYKGVQKLIKSNNTEYDIVVATSSRLFTAFLGARVSRKIGSQLYLDIRDIFIETIREVLPKKVSFFALPILKRIELWTFNSAVRINFISQSFENYARQFKKPEQFDYFTNGIDDEFIDISPDEYSVESPISIVYAGNIGEGQGLNKIVPQLANKLGPKYEIHIYGDGGRKSQLISSTTELKASNVVLHKPVSRLELLDIYKKADILFLHLNDYEINLSARPSKIFEYAAIGKPILAGVAGDPKNFMNQNVENSETFDPCQADQAYQAVQKLKLEHTDRYEFIKQYSRSSIMKLMTKSILELGDNK